MDTITGFDDFYDEKLAPALPQLRAECRQTDIWHLLIVVNAILGFGSFISYHAGVLSGVQASWLFVFFAGMGVLSVYMFARRNDRFTADFKTAIIKTIIEHLAPGMLYKPGDCVSEPEYKTSSLYRYRYDYFDGDDYMEGLIDGVSFHCSELHVQSDYAGNKQVTVFKGLFFVAKVNSRFTGGTYVWQHNQAQLSVSIMDEDYRLLPMPQVTNIHFADIDFEEQFRVCSTSPSQANEILTAGIRNNMLRINRALKGQASFSFVAGHCFIAIPIPADLLEPTEYDPGDKIEMKKYFNTISLVTNMIKQLGLANLQ